MSKKKESVRTKQCAKCPWRVDVDPNDIPDGYCPTKHRRLESTIARQGDLNLYGPVKMMGCHESELGAETPCVGWMANQLGAGNNIGLRLWAMKNLKARLELCGEQHECFEDTLPCGDDD